MKIILPQPALATLVLALSGSSLLAAETSASRAPMRPVTECIRINQI